MLPTRIVEMGLDIFSTDLSFRKESCIRELSNIDQNQTAKLSVRSLSVAPVRVAALPRFHSPNDPECEYNRLMHQSEPSTVYPASVRAIAVVASTMGFLLLVFSGLTFSLDPDTSRAIPIVELFLGISLLSYGLTHIRNSEPELIIDPLGIIHSGAGRIAWQEIDSVHIRTIRSNDIIYIHLVDTAKVTERARGAFRAYSIIASGLRIPPIAIARMQILPHTAEDVVTVMRSYYPTLRSMRT